MTVEPVPFECIAKDVLRYLFSFLNMDDMYLLFRVICTKKQRNGKTRKVEEVIQVINEPLTHWDMRLKAHRQLLQSLHVFELSRLPEQLFFDHFERMHNAVDAMIHQRGAIAGTSSSSSSASRHSSTDGTVASSSSSSSTTTTSSLSSSSSSTTTSSSSSSPLPGAPFPSYSCLVCRSKAHRISRRHPHRHRLVGKQAHWMHVSSQSSANNNNNNIDNNNNNNNSCSNVPSDTLPLRMAWAPSACTVHYMLWYSVFEHLFPILSRHGLYGDTDDEESDASLYSSLSAVDPVMSSSPLQQPLLVDNKTHIVKPRTNPTKVLRRPTFPTLLTTSFVHCDNIALYKMVDLVHQYYAEFWPERWGRFNPDTDKCVTRFMPIVFIIIGARNSGYQQFVKRMFRWRSDPDSDRTISKILLKDKTHPGVFARIFFYYFTNESIQDPPTAQKLIDLIPEAHGVFLVFDYQNYVSFETLKFWVMYPGLDKTLANLQCKNPEKEKKSDVTTSVYLIGNNAEGGRDVNTNEILRFAKDLEATFIEVSSTPNSESLSCKYALSVALYHSILFNPHLLHSVVSKEYWDAQELSTSTTAHTLSHTSENSTIRNTRRFGILRRCLQKLSLRRHS